MTQLISPVKTDWTESDLAALPDDGHRYEIIDGRLYVSPPAGENHQSAAAELFLLLRLAAPAGWRVLYEIGISIGSDRFIPDLLVLPPGTPPANADYNDVVRIKPALVVEVASRSTETTDRGDKMIAYAGGGIPTYWRMDRDGTVVLHQLTDEGSYGVVATVLTGQTYLTEFPFPIRLTSPPR